MHPPTLLQRAPAPPAGAAPERPAVPTSTLQQLDDVAVLLLADMTPRALLWGWGRIVLGSWLLRRVSGLRFAKALGSGHQGGFGLRPSVSRQGLFAVFDSDDAADDFLAGSCVSAYRLRAKELCVLKLRATSCRGTWGGHTIGVSAHAPSGEPVAALTRASIRPHRALNFWRHSPAAEAALAHADGCVLAVGVGEAPLLRQATFSLWESQAAMDAYARSGPHHDAIRGALRGGWFSESMFVRFVPLLVSGVWQGRRHG
jgi:spheroidene monooxygenase